MSKYNKKLVRDYILGNDIEEYDIEELENDVDFMIDVINYSNDSKMLLMCSYDVQTNYKMVKFIIDKFSMDTDFVCAVADEYIKATKEEDDNVEHYDIVIAMCNATKNRNHEQYTKYFLISETMYMAKQLEVDIILRTIKSDENLSREMALGFWFIFDEFNASPRVMKFFSEKYIENIFENGDVCLEDELHSHFDRFEEIEAIGINTYLLENIKTNDNNLYAYAVCHLDVLDQVKASFAKVKKNWNRYSALMEASKYNFIFDYVENYVEENENEMIHNSTQMLYTAARELGILDKIKKYDFVDVNEEDERVYINFNYVHPKELEHFNRIKEVMSDISSRRVFDEEKYKEELEAKEEKFKLLQLIRKNRNIG